MSEPGTPVSPDALSPREYNSQAGRVLEGLNALPPEATREDAQHIIADAVVAAGGLHDEDGALLMPPNLAIRNVELEPVEGGDPIVYLRINRGEAGAEDERVLAVDFRARYQDPYVDTPAAPLLPYRTVNGRIFARDDIDGIRSVNGDGSDLPPAARARWQASRPAGELTGEGSEPEEDAHELPPAEDLAELARTNPGFRRALAEQILAQPFYQGIYGGYEVGPDGRLIDPAGARPTVYPWRDLVGPLLRHENEIDREWGEQRIARPAYNAWRAAEDEDTPAPPGVDEPSLPDVENNADEDEPAENGGAPGLGRLDRLRSSAGDLRRAASDPEGKLQRGRRLIRNVVKYGTPTTGEAPEPVTERSIEDRLDSLLEQVKSSRPPRNPKSKRFK